MISRPSECTFTSMLVFVMKFTIRFLFFQLGVPIIDPSKEVWIETTSDQGKVYYYHSKTRQSIWKKPTDDNVQIISQNEVRMAIDFSNILTCIIEENLVS